MPVPDKVTEYLIKHATAQHTSTHPRNEKIKQIKRPEHAYTYAHTETKTIRGNRGSENDEVV